MNERCVNMGRHAYLIMAHNEWKLLNKLLYCIDDYRNDIFLHIDRKASFSVEKMFKPKYSKLYLTKRLDIQWGGYSQVQCEMLLLKQANKTNNYDYYHLLSGVDLPIKSQDYIHYFFEKNNGKNYIRIDPSSMNKGYGVERVKYYYFFQNFIGKKQGHIVGMLWGLNDILVKLQKKVHIDRLKKCSKKIYKGTNWFSITAEMASLVINEEKFVKKLCPFSLCADEIFIQTIAMNSSCKDTVVNEDLRCIDWKRGNPYIWKNNDVEYLLSQNSKLFARKFSYNIDSDAIENIMTSIMSK